MGERANCRVIMLVAVSVRVVVSRVLPVTFVRARAVVSAGRTAVETLGPAGASVAALAAVGGVVGFSWWALDVE